MHRIDDDAGQPCRIEQTFLEIELPGAVLLRQQQPLEFVGQASDHALQVRQLLVEIAAQPFQFFRFAQVLGANHFVELACIRLVVRPARFVALIARPPRLGRRLAVAHLGVVGHFGGRRVDGFGRRIRQFVGGGFGLRAHAFAVGGVGCIAVLALLVLLVLLVAVFAFILVGLAGAILAHVETVEQIVHHVAEAALVVEQTLEPVEILAGTLLDQRTPQLDHLACGRRRNLAGEPLAHQHSQCVLDRRVSAVGDLVEFAAVEAIVEHGSEILGDATHAPRSDGLDARLFDRLEHGAGLGAAGHQLAMHRRVVTGEPQRDGIGVTAHDGRFAFVQPSRRFRQSRLVGGNAWPFGSERNFEVALAGNRAHADADRAFERLGRRLFGGAFRLDV